MDLSFQHSNSAEKQSVVSITEVFVGENSPDNSPLIMVQCLSPTDLLAWCPGL